MSFHRDIHKKYNHSMKKYLVFQVQFAIHPFKVWISEQFENTAGGWISFLGNYFIVLGAFVSFSTHGLLDLFQMLNTTVVWAFVPLNQVMAFTICYSLWFGLKGLKKSIRIFINSFFPVYLFYLAIMVLFLVEKPGRDSLFTIEFIVFFMALFTVSVIWNLLLNFAVFWHIVKIRAIPKSTFQLILITLLQFTIHIGLYLSWFMLTNQLQPLLFS